MPRSIAASHRAPVLAARLLFAIVLLGAAMARADGEPQGLVEFRTHCKAPAAKLVVDYAALSPLYKSDPDWVFNETVVDEGVDWMLLLIANACNPNDNMGIDWRVADRLIERKVAGGTRYERPERRVPVERFAGTREIRVRFDARYNARKAFVDSGRDHRDWLKKEYGGRIDPRLLEEEMRDISNVSGMPPAMRFEGGVLTIGIGPATQAQNGLDKLFIRVVDLALAGPPAATPAPPPVAPAPKKKP